MIDFSSLTRSSTSLDPKAGDATPAPRGGSAKGPPKNSEFAKQLAEEGTKGAAVHGQRPRASEADDDDDDDDEGSPAPTAQAGLVPPPVNTPLPASSALPSASAGVFDAAAVASKGSVVAAGFAGRAGLDGADQGAGQGANHGEAASAEGLPLVVSAAPSIDPLTPALGGVPVALPAAPAKGAAGRPAPPAAVASALPAPVDSSGANAGASKLTESAKGASTSAAPLPRPASAATPPPAGAGDKAPGAAKGAAPDASSEPTAAANAGNAAKPDATPADSTWKGNAVAASASASREGSSGSAKTESLGTPRERAARAANRSASASDKASESAPGTEVSAMPLDVRSLVARDAGTFDGAPTTVAKTMTTVNGSPSTAAADGSDDARRTTRDAVASAVNQLTIRHATGGSIDLPELGRVSVNARLDNGKVDVEVHAERGETARTLATHASAIASEVRSAAVPLGRLSFDADGARHAQTAFQNGRDSGRGRDGGGQGGNGASDGDVAPGDLTITPAPSSGAARRVRIVL